jgi:phosphoenolpyruvate carboxylase
VSFKYGLPGLAYRNLEAALSATLVSAFPDVAGAEPPDGAADRPDLTLERGVPPVPVARLGGRRVRVVLPAVHADRRAGTPRDRLPPGAQARGGGLLASLRAIPWVFSWTQNRCLLPAWYGCGSAFASVDSRELRGLYSEWPFFRSLVENLEMTLAKSSLDIAAGYLDLVAPGADRERLFGVIEAEHERTVSAVLEIVDAQELLDRHPVVQRSVRLRNPYVDPMNAVQIELLRRYRDQSASESELGQVRRPSCAPWQASPPPCGTPAEKPTATVASVLRVS